MGKIIYYMSENGPTLIKPSEEYEYVSREDCLDFLDYLIRKGHHIEERKVRGLFSTFDLTRRDVEMLDRIKSFPDAESAYEAFGRTPKNRPNPNHKLMPELEKALNREFISEFAKTATAIGDLDEHPINIALQGTTGTGKTAITKQWARDHADEINFVEFSSYLLRINEIDGKKIIFTDDAMELMKKPHTVLFFDDYHLLNKDVETELNRLLDDR